MITIIDFEQSKEKVLDKIRKSPIDFQFDILKKHLISIGMKEDSKELESVLIFVRGNCSNSVKDEFYIGK